jgi:hypothetical protein
MSHPYHEEKTKKEWRVWVAWNEPDGEHRTSVTVFTSSRPPPVAPSPSHNERRVSLVDADAWLYSKEYDQSAREWLHRTAQRVGPGFRIHVQGDW